MLLGYVYKLRPSDEQSNMMDSWLDMVRGSYNYNLRDRIDAYNSRFIQGDYCDFKTKAEIVPLTCPISGATGYPWKVSGSAKVKKLEVARIFGDYCDLSTHIVQKFAEVKKAHRNAGEVQMAELPALKASRPWYSLIDSTVLQENIKRLDKAYKNFFDRKETGFPKFKSGKIFGVVPPHHTSQECPECHHIDPSNRDGEKFVCGECGYSVYSGSSFRKYTFFGFYQILC